MPSFVFMFIKSRCLQLFLLVSMSGFFHCAYAIHPAKISAANAATSPLKSRLAPDPDAMLIEVYQLLGKNKLNAAQDLADKLVAAYPTFRLGHLIRGDLLLMHNFPVNTFGAAQNAPPEKLKELRDEARARIKSLSERPNPDLVPKAILLLREDQKHALVVDAKRSRLYVYENKAGNLKFVSDYYITQGKLGVQKSKEGDQKTPLGVYYITSHVPSSKLTDFYGAGALPINYPNEWDKVNGRSGSGIWLHGTPSALYSRPPLDSDGCVVLTNPDLQKLYSSVEIGKTPIVISDQVEFVTQATWNAERELATKLITDWRLAVESRDRSRWFNNYSNSFKSAQGEALPLWFSKQQSPLIGATDINIKLSDVTAFYYPGKENMLVSTFTQDTRYGRYHNVTRKRQYWEKEGASWKIIFEGVI